MRRRQGSHKLPEEPSSGSKAATVASQAAGQPERFGVAKVAILTLLGAVYFVAFLGAYFQNSALMGERGLVPARPRFEQLSASFPNPVDGFANHPSVWWFVGSPTDANCELLALVGMGLSALTIFGWHSHLALAALWCLYFSIVTLAESTSFYQYGWESQLLETGKVRTMIFLSLVHTYTPFPQPRRHHILRLCAQGSCASSFAIFAWYLSTEDIRHRHPRRCGC